MSTIVRQVGSGRTFLSPTDFFVEADTSGGQVEIVLPNSELIFANSNDSNTPYSYVGVRVVDISNNASVNNIVIYGFDGDVVNGVQTLTINKNGGGGIVTLIGQGQWSFEYNKIIVPPTINYGLFSQTSDSSPIINTSNFQSLIGSGQGILSVPANGFNVADSFVARMGGQISNLNNTNIQIVVLGNSLTTTLIDTGLFSLSQSTNKFWEMVINFTIRNIGSAGMASIISSGSFKHIRNNGAMETFGFNTINNTTFDTTIVNTLDIEAKWQTASNSNSIYSSYFTLNKIF